MTDSANTSRTGLWLVGAWGGVSTTVAVGLAALQLKKTGLTGLVSELPWLAELPLPQWGEFVVGGHEIRETSFAAEAKVLQTKSNLFSEQLLADVTPALEQWNQNVVPGTLIGVGQTIEDLASGDVLKTTSETPLETINRLKKDLTEFRTRNQLDHVIMVNLSSTEPPVDPESIPESWAEIDSQLQSGANLSLPASTLYAIAALTAESSFVNFTPSLGSDLPAMNELALKEGTLHCGRDGKTGETLLKSVLAPMFASRNLNVMSWVGHNIFGNMDGIVLNDPANKATKVKSKDHLLTEILGYKPQSLVSIEYIESLGDWKTAWDHVHFEGFLGTKMTMQVTWQGCDSILAAPLVLDLVRLTEVERRRGGTGLQDHLGCFFKSPMGADTAEFALQCERLKQWAADVKAGN